MTITGFHTSVGRVNIQAMALASVGGDVQREGLAYRPVPAPSLMSVGAHMFMSPTGCMVPTPPSLPPPSPSHTQLGACQTDWQLLHPPPSVLL